MLEHCKLEKLVLVQPAGFSFHSEGPSSSRCRQIVADTRKIDRDETGNVCDRLLAVSNALSPPFLPLFVLSPRSQKLVARRTSRLTFKSKFLDPEFIDFSLTLGGPREMNGMLRSTFSRATVSPALFSILISGMRSFIHVKYAKDTCKCGREICAYIFVSFKRILKND